MENPMTCKDIIEKLEVLSPIHFAQSWDNVGLLVGRKEKRVYRVLLCVDIDETVVDRAISEKVDMIISHHPFLFSGIKKITDADFLGRRILGLIQADICVYAMHTNFDIMGMADAAVEKLGLMDRVVLQKTYEDEISVEGFGRVGKLKQVMSLKDLALFVKDSFEIEHVKVFGNLDLMCLDVAICPGSGKSLVKDVVEKNADVYITGDVDHHTALDLLAEGVCVIDAGHYGIEKLFVHYMNQYFKKMLPEIELIDSEEMSPYQVI